MPKDAAPEKTGFLLASVIIINWNNYEMTKKCIESVIKNTEYPNFEVWLIDNGSTDKSFEKLKKEFPFLKTIKNEKNKGFPYALNQGYRSAKGVYLVPLNNDAVVLNGWLSEAIKVIESGEKIAVAGCTEVSAEEANDWRALEKIRGRPNVEKMTLPVAWVTTKKMIEKIGYMDTEFFSPIYGEEADWNFRARKLGYRIIRASKSNVIHLSSQDTKKILGAKKQWVLMNFHRHRAILFNLSIFDILHFVPGLLYIVFAAIEYGMLFPLLKSYWLTLKDWKLILRQRKKKRIYVEFKEPTFTLVN